jgi:hypothetical protein
MNEKPEETLTITVNGELTLARADLEQLLRQLIQAQPGRPVATVIAPPIRNQEPAPLRLAYRMRETAEALGVSNITVWRLMKRGHLRSSGAVWTKIIAKTEIVRFLKETSRPF